MNRATKHAIITRWFALRRESPNEAEIAAFYARLTSKHAPDYRTPYDYNLRHTDAVRREYNDD